MILKDVKNKTLFGYLVIFLLIIILLFFIVYDSRKAQLNIYDNILSNNLGFSSFSQLVGENNSNPQKTFNLIRKTNKIAYNYIVDGEKKNFFEKIYINIKFKNYRKILKDRERALKDKIGSNFSEVNGSLLHLGKKMRIKVRLKGDLSDHWRSLKRLSFRIKIKGGDTFMGYKTFSLQKPSSRQHPYDQVFQKLQQDVDNLSSAHSYVHLFVNGEDWGIMNIEEHISKEFLEKQHSKESIVVRFGNEEKWVYDTININPYPDYLLSDERLNVKIYNGKKYLKNNLYRKQYSYITKEHLNERLSLYDEKSFLKSFLLAMYWGTTHTLSSGNSRYYFNPYTLKLETITTDQAKFRFLIDGISVPDLYGKIINTESYKSNYQKIIKTVEIALRSSQKIFDEIQSIFPLDEKINANLVKDNFNLIKGKELEFVKSNIQPYIDDISSVFDKILKPTKNQAKNFTKHIYARHYDNGDILIYNLLPDTVKIIEVLGKDNFLHQKVDLLIQGFDKNKGYQPLVLNTKLLGIHDNEISIITSYKGYKRKHALRYTIFHDDLYNPLLHSYSFSDTKKFNFLSVDREEDGSNMWHIKKGEWVVDRPIVINGNLEIEEGVVLKFKENSYLIVKGALIAKGSDSKNIVLKPYKDTWKGVYVLNGVKDSILQHVVIENTKGLADGILDLTGGVTFYNSNVNISSVTIKGSKAEDAINFVKSSYTIDNIKISESVSDGLDSDFSSGIIKNSKFIKVYGDAIDLSGSEVKIKDTYFNSIYDKAISAGEVSIVDISDVKMDDVGVGVASKDGSRVNARRLAVSNYKIKAFMTYKKKSFYNYPASLNIYNSFVENEINAYARQNNTSLIIDGILYPEKNIDVKKMYQDTVMKK